MNKKILALRYRPKFFSEVVGQDFCIKSLSNSIRLNKIHSAYLFSGTRGVGKTTIARIFAKSLLCKQGISDVPCGKCESCLAIDENNNLDLIEIDAASRTKVEDTRTLMENVQYSPTTSRFKIYLIDEVHMLSTKSFNALLKTIEEPPDHVKFLLATTDPDKLPETVISRCLHFKLHSITKEILSSHIQNTLKKEDIKFESQVPSIVAEAARGSARDSMSILEQCISYGDGDLKNDEISDLLGIIDEQFVDDIIKNLHNDNISAIQNLLDQVDINNHHKLLDSIIERVSQISISRATNSNNYHLPESFLQTAINLEDLQLWYSLLLQAKAEISNASSKLDYILMILLRITLFTNYPDAKDTELVSEIQITDAYDKKKDDPQITESVRGSGVAMDDWRNFVDSNRLQGLMLDLAHNSIINCVASNVSLLIDATKKNTYPKKCIDDFNLLITKYFNGIEEVQIEYKDQIDTLYNQSVAESLKSKKDMYDSIKDNAAVKEIEDVFDAKIDKENISKV